MNSFIVSLTESFNAVETNPFSAYYILYILICLGLVYSSAFLSASETSFFSLSPNDISELDEENKSHKILLDLRSNPEKLLATILIANDFVNIGLITLATFTINSMVDFSNALLLGFVVQTILITFILLLFSEILPKIYATHHAKKIAIIAAPVLKFCQQATAPFVKLLVNSTKTINKKLASKKFGNISVNQLSNALKLTTNSEEDNEILEGIVKFGNINVNQIMTPRTQMVDIEITSSFKQVLERVIESGYSRMPVYSKTEDNIKGILYIKDLLPHLEKNNQFKWQTLIRQAYFVPETKMIDDLLADFQKDKIHIAIVVDEFGGTSGLITLEDILEEIVGEINDEYDDDDKLYTLIDKNTYLFEAKIMLTDFFKIEGIDEFAFSKIAEEADTLAGLILELKGEIPSVNELIRYKNYAFEIVEADDRHIEKVKLHLNEPYEQDDAKNTV